jgi:hypothetical protein
LRPAQRCRWIPDHPFSRRACSPRSAAAGFPITRLAGELARRAAPPTI